MYFLIVLKRKDVRTVILSKVTQVGIGKARTGIQIFLLPLRAYSLRGIDMRSCSDTLVWGLTHQITEKHSTVARPVRHGQDTLTGASVTYLLVFRPNLEIARKQ